MLGEIKSISPLLISGIIPQEALEIGGWSYLLKEDDLPTDKVPDKPWRTLVAGHQLGGQRPPAWFKHAYLYSLQREDHSGDIHTRDLIDAQDLLEIDGHVPEASAKRHVGQKISKGGDDGEILDCFQKH